MQKKKGFKKEVESQWPVNAVMQLLRGEQGAETAHANVALMQVLHRLQRKQLLADERVKNETGKRLIPRSKSDETWVRYRC